MNKLLSPLVGAALASVTIYAHADFIDDSHADVTLLNRYLNQDGQGVSGSTAKAKSYHDWGQGFQFDFKSGYTEGTIGLGLDLQAFYGLQLDSGGDLDDKTHQGRYPGSIFPLDNGKSVDQFGVISPTFKARFLKDELRVGTLYQNNPMLANTDRRLYRPDQDPQRNRRHRHYHRRRYQEERSLPLRRCRLRRYPGHHPERLVL